MARPADRAAGGRLAPHLARAWLPALVAVLALPAGACGGSDLGSTTTRGDGGTPVSPGTLLAGMRSLEFNPVTIHARVGETVTWINHDSAPHNVTYVSGPKFASSPTISPRRRFSLRLTEPGTIRYYCTIHPWMKATIAVAS
jgi:plastocyanin